MNEYENTDMKKLLALLALAGTLTGCATGPQAPAPDVTINAPLAQVREALAAEMANRKATIVKLDDNLIVAEKPMEGNGALVSQLVLGNAYSTTPKGTVQFVLLQPQPDTVRVLGSASISTQMAFGQTNSMEATGAYAGMTKMLNDIKTRLER